jgi:hypothetical protein
MRMGGWEAAFVRSKRRKRWPFRPMDVNVDAWSLRPSLACGVMAESQQARYGTSTLQQCRIDTIRIKSRPTKSEKFVYNVNYVLVRI